MKKKFMCMFMAAAMVFTMAACGSKTDTNTGDDANTGDQPSAAETQTFALLLRVKRKERIGTIMMYNAVRNPAFPTDTFGIAAC